jgi:hypothetical protein
MKNKLLKSKDFLQVFDLISSKGFKSNGKYQFQGIDAWHDFDGYTCWLSYKDLTITLLFHGKLGVEYENVDTFDEFYKKINGLIALS